MSSVRKAVLWLANRRPNEAMVKRGKTHQVFAIKRPWKHHYAGGAYYPDLVIVWRKRDTISFTVYPWLNARRVLFSRCEGCGGRFKWGEGPTRTLEHMHAPHTKSIMLGETGLYHWGCPHDRRAEDGSTEGWDRQWGHDDGLRRQILNEPVDVALELSMLATARREAEWTYRKRLTETRRELGLSDFAWKIPDNTEVPR